MHGKKKQAVGPMGVGRKGKRFGPGVRTPIGPQSTVFTWGPGSSWQELELASCRNMAGAEVARAGE